MKPVLESICLFAQDGVPQPPAGGSPISFLPFIMIAVLFYLLLVRPERRKQAEHLSMLQTLKKNDRVLTASGIFGTIAQVNPGSDEVLLKIDEGNNKRIRILRSSISRILSETDAGDAKVE